MQIKPIKHSSLYCIFADEQRREADGRDIVLGWYPDGAKIAMPTEGPAILPRLAVIAVLMIPVDSKPTSMEFSLVLGESTLHTQTVPPQFFDEATEPNTSELGPLRAGVFRVAVQVHNLVVNDPGRLRAHIVLGDITLDSNSLQFVRQTENEVRSFP